MKVPFGSSDPRYKAANKHIVPGPGSYIDVNNTNYSSICKNLTKISEERTLAESQGVKLGAFGTTAAKNYNSWLNPKEGPGPGYYEDTTASTNFH